MKTILIIFGLFTLFNVCISHKYDSLILRYLENKENNDQVILKRLYFYFIKTFKNFEIDCKL